MGDTYQPTLTRVDLLAVEMTGQLMRCDSVSQFGGMPSREEGETLPQHIARSAYDYAQAMEAESAKR